MAKVAAFHTQVVTRRGAGDDVGSRFGRGRTWAQRTPLQRVSRVLDVIVVVVLCACAGYTVWLLLINPG